MFEEEYLSNHAWWEERAEFHPATKLYQQHIQSLQDGEISLHQLELSEVGDVVGKHLLHLQCHIGTDSLSWARRGAIVTGVDFSKAAIHQATRLADELKLRASFVHSNIYELHDRLAGQFDIVFSSYGAITWLHDLKSWAASIAQFLKPGGFFYLVDAHPMLLTIDDQWSGDPELVRLAYPYFEHSNPVRLTDEGSYADRALPTKVNVTYEWMHSISEILMSQIDAGLTIEAFGEHRGCPWQALPCCALQSDGLFYLPDGLRDRIPLLFSLKARKPDRTRMAGF